MRTYFYCVTIEGNRSITFDLKKLLLQNEPNKLNIPTVIYLCADSFEQLNHWWLYTSCGYPNDESVLIHVCNTTFKSDIGKDYRSVQNGVYKFKVEDE